MTTWLLWQLDCYDSLTEITAWLLWHLDYYDSLTAITADCLDRLTALLAWLQQQLDCYKSLTALTQTCLTVEMLSHLKILSVAMWTTQVAVDVTVYSHLNSMHTSSLLPALWAWLWLTALPNWPPDDASDIVREHKHQPRFLLRGIFVNMLFNIWVLSVFLCRTLNRNHKIYFFNVLNFVLFCTI